MLDLDRKIEIAFQLNGESAHVAVSPDATLLATLRDELDLSGTKLGCGEGECGACSVLLNGKVVNSCLVLAAECDQADIVTIEGLAINGQLNPLQQAFVDHGAIQCGYCTPGMIMTAHALLADNASPTEADVIRGLEGNLCRCTGYRKIIDAVLAAAGGGPRT